MTAEEEQREDLIATSPAAFSELFLGNPVYDWQAEIMNWYRDPRLVTRGMAQTPNGAGKSSGIVAPLALWWLYAYPKGKVVITSASSLQIEQQLYPAMERHREKFPCFNFVTSPYVRITNGLGGVIIAHTTNDPGKAEGHHPAPDTKELLGIYTGPVLMIVDEAKTVPEEIFTAVDRCSYQGLLYVSSPGTEEGRFYKSSKNPGFKKCVVSLKDCPHVSQGKIDRIIADYGEDHPFTRSSVYGEFMKEGDMPYVFPKGAVRSAMSNPPQKKHGHVTLFCDFAAGTAENTIGKCEGNGLSLADRWRESDTRIALNRFILGFRRCGFTEKEAGRIFGDNGGVGKAMIDGLWEMGWQINRVDNQTPPFDKNYMNRGAEMWHETAGALRRAECVFEPDLCSDEEFFEQLTSRRSAWSPNGKLGVEKKEDMAKRGVKSPDRADCIVGAWFCRSLLPEVTVSEWEERWLQDYQQDGGMWLPAGASTGQ